MTTRVVRPLATPPDAVVRVPGSKSITNRALLVAALAVGSSTLRGVLRADDTEAMVGALRALGVRADVDGDGARVEGGAGRMHAAAVDAREAGTVARFVAPLGLLSAATVSVDGAPQLVGRPMGPMIDALRDLGAQVIERGAPERLPISVSGPVRGGEVYVRGDVSSQFVSGLMIVAPLLPDGLRIVITTELVSRPYLDMTAAVMRAFGATVEVGDTVVEVPPGGYRGRDYAVEPDASAASYFFAAAAVCGGRVTVDGLGAGSLQGDLAFVDRLAWMGATVRRERERTTVEAGQLSGVETDMSQVSDTVPSLAVVAPFASSPTRMRGIDFIRRKESDRVGGLVAQLRAVGVDAEEELDGVLVRPSVPRAGRVETYGDHRLAMSFAVLGLRIPGIEIVGADCVAKTFPSFFDALDQLRGR